MTNVKLIILIFLLANPVVVIKKEERIMSAMLKLGIVTALRMSQGKNVTNVNLDSLIFLIAKVSKIIMMPMAH